tara:strand:- start:1972 stop:3177 length:1206 start_codon:yes stop_codon:yes gene_type:complete
MSNDLLKKNDDFRSSSIGVVGGGQLAQMLVLAAKNKNVKISVQTSSKNDPAASQASRVVLLDSQDIDGTRELAKFCKFITFENEWVNIDSLSTLEAEGAKFLPTLESISPLVDKISQRKLLKKLDIPVAEWHPLLFKESSDVNLAFDWEFPLMAKRSKGGYDGKGTKVIRDSKELNDFLISKRQEEWFLEKWVNYEKELSIVATRDLDGCVRSFPLVETCQSNQVCDWVLAPAEVSHSVEIMALNIASSLLMELDYIGVLTIEFFYGDEGLIVNEIAPRTHNSAHFSIEACSSSQFDQQVCITAGLPVAPIKLNFPGALMINLLGIENNKDNPLEKRLSQIRDLEGANLHWYDKGEELYGRKLGHVTFLLNNDNASIRRQQAMALIKKVRKIWPKYVANVV